MKLVRLAAAGCGLVFLAACAAGPVSDAAQDLQPLDVRPSAPASSGEAQGQPSGRHPLGNGLAITASAPKVFTPTSAAYPHTPRAVAFELTINNQGDAIYRSAQLTVAATSNGAPAPQVIDSTQGYTGFVGAGDEVAPGQHIRIAVAFAVPDDPAEVRLVVRADPTTAEVTLFQGTV